MIAARFLITQFPVAGSSCAGLGQGVPSISAAYYTSPLQLPPQRVCIGCSVPCSAGPSWEPDDMHRVSLEHTGWAAPAAPSPQRVLFP